MENTAPKTGKFALKFGLLLGGINLILGIMLYAADMHYQQGWEIGVISMIIMIIVIIIAIKQFKKANGGYLSFGEGIKVGLGLTLIAAIIGISYGLLLSTVVDPEMLAKSLEFKESEMIASGDYSSEQIKTQMAAIKMSSTPMIQAGLGIVGSLFLGFVFSLIPTLVMKKNKE